MSNFEFRVVAARYIDELFYEKGSARRNRRKVDNAGRLFDSLFPDIER